MRPGPCSAVKPAAGLACPAPARCSARIGPSVWARASVWLSTAAASSRACCWLAVDPVALLVDHLGQLGRGGPRAARYRRRCVAVVVNSSPAASAISGTRTDQPVRGFRTAPRGAGRCPPDGATFGARVRLRARWLHPVAEIILLDPVPARPWPRAPR